MASVPEPPAVGQPARSSASQRLGFCPFCRVYMREGYELLQAADAEIIQVGPTLLQSARTFFGHSPTPYPSSAIQRTPAPSSAAPGSTS